MYKRTKCLSLTLCGALLATNLGLANIHAAAAQLTNENSTATNEKSLIKSSTNTVQADGTVVEDTFYKDNSRKITIKSKDKTDVMIYKNGVMRVNGSIIDLSKTVKKLNKVNNNLNATNSLQANLASGTI